MYVIQTSVGYDFKRHLAFLYSTTVSLAAAYRVNCKVIPRLSVGINKLLIFHVYWREKFLS